VVKFPTKIPAIVAQSWLDKDIYYIDMSNSLAVFQVYKGTTLCHVTSMLTEQIFLNTFNTFIFKHLIGYIFILGN
jgi:hypothetical protein